MSPLLNRILLYSCLAAVAAGTTGCPVQTWVKHFGGSGVDVAYDVVVAADGGYLVAGRGMSNGPEGNAAYFVKLNAAGAVMWDRYVGGSLLDFASAAVQADDGGYLAVGRTQSVGAGSSDVYIIKLESDGDVQWSTTYGSAGGDGGNAVRKTADGGYIIAGFYTPSQRADFDAYLLKVNSAGAFQWDQTFGGSDTEAFTDVRPTTDGGYIAVGVDRSEAIGVLWEWLVVKTDANGVEQWSETYGSPLNDSASGVVQTADGGYAICGQMGIADLSAYSMFLLKIDAAGAEQWRKSYNTGVLSDGNGIAQTSDGGFILTGRAPDSIYNVYLVKTDADGNEEWHRSIGGNDIDEGYAVKTTMDGGYIVAGVTESFGNGEQMYVLKLDSDGYFSIPIFIPRGGLGGRGSIF